MASPIGKALGYSMDSEEEAPLSSEPGDEAPPSKKDTKAPSAEVLAMKQFERAKTPEAKVEALRSFLSACGVSYDEE